MKEYRIYSKHGSMDIIAEGFAVKDGALIFSINEEIICIFKDWESFKKIDNEVK